MSKLSFQQTRTDWIEEMPSWFPGVDKEPVFYLDLPKNFGIKPAAPKKIQETMNEQYTYENFLIYDMNEKIFQETERQIKKQNSKPKQVIMMGKLVNNNQPWGKYQLLSRWMEGDNSIKKPTMQEIKEYAIMWRTLHPDVAAKNIMENNKRLNEKNIIRLLECLNYGVGNNITENRVGMIETIKNVQEIKQTQRGHNLINKIQETIDKSKVI